MQFTFQDRMRRAGQNILGLLLFGNIMSALGNGDPGSSLVYYLVGAVALLLSTLLFWLIWHTPRWASWDGYRVILLFLGCCVIVSHLGWVYGPTWGLSPPWGHVLGTIVGGILALGMMFGEDRTISVRKGALMSEPRRALGA